MVAIVVGVVIAHFSGSPDARLLWLLLACSLPAFSAGITEDLTKSVSPRRRLVATAISAGLAIWLLGAVIARTDVPGVDQRIHLAPLSVLLTVFVITGMANAVNIIDGFNGLASMCVLMMILALFLTHRAKHVRGRVHDGPVCAARAPR
jgi:UDP-N-acetylmuramyl pentapeptide phosphotransferase/UDP-N-acetylglucosamine-1-phosphate transferase